MKESFNVYIKEPRTGRAVKVTRKPVRLKEAQDTRAYFLDETTSRTGSIKPNKQRPSPLQYDIPRGYAQDTQGKFRAYRVRRGMKQPLIQTIIEKNRYLIDTRGEKKQINIFKKMAQVEKRQQNNKLVGLEFA